MIAYQIKQGILDLAIGRHQAIRVMDVEWLALPVAHMATGFLDQEQTRGKIPRLEPLLKKAIVTATSNISQVQSCYATAPDLKRVKENALDPGKGFMGCLAIVGIGAEADQAVLELADFTGPDRPAVQRDAQATDSCE